MKEIKTLGGIGAILGLLIFLPYIGFVLEIVSIVLLLVAMSKLSTYYNNKEIFNKYLIGFILSIVSSVVLIILLGSAILSIFTSSQESLSILEEELTLLIIVYMLLIIGMANWKKSFSLLSNLTNINYFNTAGNLYLWGAITAPLLIGGILFIAADIILAIAFFNLPD
ncbi:MAG: DUF996 domain-containing protein [Dictyoglomus thermophilum]|nr:DUF996 domain-containing protein [Dictyoglomus thermophilum]MCX7720864.1 DUF996 domain-containing protein [Dictyoglomus thermophilum]